MPKPILDPKLVFKLVDDIWQDYLVKGETYLIDTLIDLGLIKKSVLTEEYIQENKLRWTAPGKKHYSYSLEDITEKLLVR